MAKGIFKGKVHDTMLYQHLRFPDLPHGLEFVGSQFSSKPAWKDDKSCLELYNARDVDITMQVFKQIIPMVKSAGLLRTYELVSVPLARICHGMTKQGIVLNPDRIIEVRGKILAEMAQLELALPPEMRSFEETVNRRAVAPAGTLGKSGKPVKFVLVPEKETRFPWRSSLKKQAFLYGTAEPWQLGLPAQTKSDTENITTDKIALEKLCNRERDPKRKAAIRSLQRLNKLDELVTTFAKEEMTRAKRMHPNFNVHGTASGRLSSSEPNLQNVPESTRFIYVPSEPGWKLVEVDYSQIENRLTAFLAGDSERLERFLKDPKFSEHKYLASLFLKVAYEDVVKSSDPDSPYLKAKKIVHGSNYGMGFKKISKMNDLDPREIKELQFQWKQQIVETVRWQERITEEAKRQGFLTTPFGRKRWFYTTAYFTEALSFLPQSAAADIIFRAMIILMHERIGWPLEKVQELGWQIVKPLPEPARLLLQVHDSLLIECPAEQIAEVVATVRSVMEQPIPQLDGFSIPIGVKVGLSWGEAEEYVPQQS